MCLEKCFQLLKIPFIIWMFKVQRTSTTKITYLQSKQNCSTYIRGTDKCWPMVTHNPPTQPVPLSRRQCQCFHACRFSLKVCFPSHNSMFNTWIMMASVMEIEQRSCLYTFFIEKRVFFEGVKTYWNFVALNHIVKQRSSKNLVLDGIWIRNQNFEITKSICDVSAG